MYVNWQSNFYYHSKLMGLDDFQIELNIESLEAWLEKVGYNGTI